MTGRALLLVIALLLAAAACGDATEQAPSPTSATASAPDSGTAPAASQPAPAATASPSAAPTTAPLDSAADYEVAPDFALALQNRSGSYSLANSDRPLYLVFWAEW